MISDQDPGYKKIKKQIEEARREQQGDPATVPARRPEDDALDRLERLIPPPHAALNRTEYQEAKTLLATVRSALEQLREERDARMTKESGRALIEDANRWERAYREARDEAERLREERDTTTPLHALREKNRELRASLEAAEAEVRRLTEGLRDFDEKWYPTLASRAVIEEQSHHPTAAAIWGQLCKDFRALLSASPSDGGWA